MNKDFSQQKLLAQSLEKQFKTLYDLALFIEAHQAEFGSPHFQKLLKYHRFLADSPHEKMQHLNKEFAKVKELNRQFGIYLMNLERFIGQSKKEYDFLVNQVDKENKSSPIGITCILDSVRSAHNIGAFFRNSDCFNIEKVYLTGLSPKSDHPQVIKTAMGTETSTPSEYFENAKDLIKKLKADGHIVWSIETGNDVTNLYDIETLPKKLVLVFGHEQYGISLELLQESDLIVEIPLFGDKNSLNVSVSQAIVLSYLRSLS